MAHGRLEIGTVPQWLGALALVVLAVLVGNAVAALREQGRRSPAEEARAEETRRRRLDAAVEAEAALDRAAGVARALADPLHGELPDRSGRALDLLQDVGPALAQARARAAFLLPPDAAAALWRATASLDDLVLASEACARSDCSAQWPEVVKRGQARFEEARRAAAAALLEAAAGRMAEPPAPERLVAAPPAADDGRQALLGACTCPAEGAPAEAAPAP